MARSALVVPVAALAAAVSGCGSEEPPAPSSPQDAGADVIDAVAPCGPGEARVGDECVKAGVPADACGEGFSPDDCGGCDPVLPPDACGRGTMAVPGEARCRAVAPCGAAPWGDIPVDDSTRYVDASYAGGDSDGTADRPWTTLQAAIFAARPGDMVAIAEGVYAESPFLGGKQLRIWGRCPELVEIGGVGQFEGLMLDADGTELHTAAVTSESSLGLLVGAKGVVVDRVWVHDTGDYGIMIAGFLAPTDAVIRGSLVERASGAGIVVFGAATVIEASVVRGGVPNPSIGPGRGLDIEDDPELGVRADVTLGGSLIEGNRESGVVVFGSDFSMESTVVRDTSATVGGKFGVGVAIQPSVGPSKVELVTSVVSNSRVVGVSVLASEAEVRRCVVSSTAPEELGGLFGDGIAVVTTGGAATLTLAESLVADSARAGVASFGGGVTIGAAALDCNSIHLDGETLASAEYSFEDQGGNACGCGAESTVCQVLSTDLASPTALP